MKVGTAEDHKGGMGAFKQGVVNSVLKRESAVGASGGVWCGAKNRGTKTMPIGTQYGREIRQRISCGIVDSGQVRGHDPMRVR